MIWLLPVPPGFLSSRRVQPALDSPWCCTPGCAFSVLRGFVLAVPSVWNTLFLDPNCVIKFNWKVSFSEPSFLTTRVASSLSGSCHPVLILCLTLTSTCNFLDHSVIFFVTISPTITWVLWNQGPHLLSSLPCPLCFYHAWNTIGSQ